MFCIHPHLVMFCCYDIMRVNLRPIFCKKKWGAVTSAVFAAYFVTADSNLGGDHIHVKALIISFHILGEKLLEKDFDKSNNTMLKFCS